MSTALQETTPTKLMARDDSPFANLLDTAKFEHLWRVAKIFASSELVPEHYRGKAENCFVSLQMAFRLKVDPLMLIQNSYLVKGRPAVETKFAVALLNASGRIKGTMKYRVSGDGQTLSCVAYCVEAGSGEVIEHELDWKTVVKRGWDQNDQWKKDPRLMIQYRAAIRLIRLHFPEVLMGMTSKEEAEELATIEVTPSQVVENKPAPVVSLPRPRQTYAERRRSAVVEVEPKPVVINEDAEPTADELAEIEAQLARDSEA